MKVLNPNTGQFEEVYVKALDSLPVGTEIDFDGAVSDIPTGWEQVDVYSTTEVKTGDTWINNKPIYRRVFVLGTEILIQTGTWKDILDVSTLNIQAITNIRLLNNNNWFWTGAITRIVNNNLQLASVGRDNTDWYLKTIVLEYTKTTD